MLTSRVMTDKTTGRSIQCIGRQGTHTNHSYFTAMTWRPDSRRICLHTHLESSTREEGYAWFDVESGETEVIKESPCLGAVISMQDQVLYFSDAGREIWVKDLPTNEERLVSRFQEGMKTRGVLSVTNDGSYIGANIDFEETNGAGLINVQTGELEKFVNPNFTKPSFTGHTMVNPVDPNRLFYCHESKDNLHRMWLADVRRDTAQNIYRQKRLEDGTVVEYIGHEMWEFNGNGMYFVKCIKSPLKPSGVYYTDTQDINGKFINGDYRYWHVAISPDGNYAVADTKEEDWKSKIILINIKTKEATLLCEAPCWENHPGHPHPSFSPDSRKVCFTFADEQNELHVGIIRL